MAIVTHLVTRLRAGFGLATWMQTTGAALVAAELCSQGRARMTAQDGHSAHGLLYLAAVRADSVSKNTVKAALTSTWLVINCLEVRTSLASGLRLPRSKGVQGAYE